MLPDYLMQPSLPQATSAIEALPGDILSLKAKNRLVSAITSPKNELFTRLDLVGLTRDQYYISLARDQRLPQRSDSYLKDLIHRYGNESKKYQQHCQFFTNPLLPIASDPALPPKERTANAGFYFHTFESDRVTLDEQVLWTVGDERKGKNKAYELHQRLSDFDDYRGAYFIWSGNKSVHIHVEFDLSHLDEFLNPTLLRKGLAAQWEKLAAVVAETLSVDSNVFDRSLRFPESYRRLPWGMREGSKLFSEDQKIPQIEIWSKRRKNPAEYKGQVAHVNEDFYRAADSFKRPGAKANRGKLSSSPDMQAFISFVRKMCQAEFMADYPKAEDYKIDENNDVTLYFRNSPSDHNPSSVMVGDFNSILIYSQDSELLEKDYILPFSANELFNLFHGMPSDYTRMEGARPLPRSFFVTYPSILKWSGKTTSSDQQKNSFRKGLELLLSLMADSPAKTNLILAPEGAGKSEALLNLIPPRHEFTEGAVLFACKSYDQAEELFERFKEKYPNKRGRVLPSISMLYKQLNDRGSRFLNPEEILSVGCSSLLEAIYRHEPATAKKMEAWKHEHIGADFSGSIFFTVHEVAKKWHIRNSTRTWLTKNFDASILGSKKSDLYYRRLHEQSRVSHIIYDEFSRDDLRFIHSREKVENFFAFSRLYPNPGTELMENLSEFNEANQDNKLTVNDYMEFRNIHYAKGDKITLAAPLEKIGTSNKKDSMYDFSHASYYMKLTDWWQETDVRKNSPRLVILTTEASVFTMANRVNAMLASKEGQSKQPGFQLFDLNEYITLPDAVRTAYFQVDSRARNEGGEKRKGIPALVNEIYSAGMLGTLELPGKNWRIVTNSYKGRWKKMVTTHSKAKGSNAFNGYDLVSIYSYPAQEQFRRLNFDAAFFGLTDSIRYHYLDELNQTLGRNLGFRFNDKKHIIVMSPRFKKDFLAFFLEHSRYKLLPAVLLDNEE